MRKAYAIAEFLSDDNKLEMKKTAGECGFNIAFFDSDEEAAGKVSDAEVIYCKDPQLFGEMPGLKWCHSAFAGVGPFISSGVFDNGSVILTNSSGSYGLTISEYVVMVTLMLMKRFDAEQDSSLVQNPGTRRYLEFSIEALNETFAVRRSLCHAFKQTKGRTECVNLIRLQDLKQHLTKTRLS